MSQINQPVRLSAEGLILNFSEAHKEVLFLQEK